jgi:hypothetical protein
VQSNVKRSLFAGTLSLFLLSGLLIAYFLMLDTPTPATDVPSQDSEGIHTKSNDGVTYVGDGFEITEYTHSVKRGEIATVTVVAEKEDTLDISVYYASGKSSASVFSPKTVGKASSAEWKWTVPVNITVNKIRVVIRSSDTYAILYIDII